MTEPQVVLRAITAEEILKFRRALIADLLSAKAPPGDSIQFPNGMKWDYNRILRSYSGFPSENFDYEEENWCGTVGCAMGRLPMIPIFRKAGFNIRFADGEHGTKIPDYLLFDKYPVADSAIPGSHFLGISPKEFDRAFWGGEYGRNPRLIAEWLEILPPPEDQPEKSWFPLTEEKFEPAEELIDDE
jgi:hypothetical protein